MEEGQEHCPAHLEVVVVVVEVEEQLHQVELVLQVVQVVVEEEGEEVELQRQSQAPQLKQEEEEVVEQGSKQSHNILVSSGFAPLAALSSTSRY